MGEFAETIIINAPQETVWSALADIGSIYQWNPGVVDSKQTSAGEVKLGSSRLCDLGGKNYLDEQVVTFDPLNKITMRIVDTNMPFETADIRFTLNQSEQGTEVTVSPVYQLKYGIVGRLLDRVMVKNQYQKGMKGLLKGLKSHVEQAS